MSIERDYFEETVAQIREHWFPKHVARCVTYDVASPGMANPPIHSLVWAQPGTSTYLVRYLLINSTLMVTGDIGSAIYRWGHDKEMGFHWIANCNFSYFASKIEGLHRGGDAREWCAEVCERKAKEFFKRKFKRIPELRGSTAFAQEWVQFINANEKLFGSWDACSDAAVWGLVPSNRCIGHWMGLRMAMGVDKQ